MLAIGFSWRFPVDASTHGHEMDRLTILMHWFMAVLFVGWGIFFVYCLIRYRSRPGHQPSTYLPKAKASKYSEILVVIVEAVLLIGFSFPIWASVRGVQNAPKEALEVRVVAEQFAWNIHYPGRDGVFGNTETNLIDAQENPLGLDRDDPAAKDDIVTINQFHLPVNQDVLVHLTSKDVIHSFGVPQLRVKQDAIPGMSIPIWFKAKLTTDQVREKTVESYPTRLSMMPLLKNHVAMEDCQSAAGEVIVPRGGMITEQIVTELADAGIEQVLAAPDVPTQIACAQLCGLGHYRMRGYVHIDTQEQYAKWWEEEEQLLLEAEEEDY